MSLVLVGCGFTRGLLYAVFCRALDSHLRVTQAETLGLTRKPHTEMTPHRDYHSDPPHDVADGDRAGAIEQPFPDAIMQITCIFYFSASRPGAGGTWVVPGSAPTDSFVSPERFLVDILSVCTNAILRCRCWSKAIATRATREALLRTASTVARRYQAS